MEVTIVMVMNSTHAMMHHAKLPLVICYHVWHEAYKTVTIAPVGTQNYATQT